MSTARTSHILTDGFSAELRSRAIRVGSRELLISRLEGSAQERDLTKPPNCNGYGRIRHFRRATSRGWPTNPLPIDPACRALGLPRADVLRAQAFQNAACNWRCWYCYVPFDLLAAKPERSAWFTADELVRLYAAEANRPDVIDLTGGQPDLTPEWVPWTIEALDEQGLSENVYLWSDDNLSNDYYFRFLSDTQRETIAKNPRYGRVCCFKGYNEESFAFNTKAAPELFERQFAVFRRLLAEGLDLYAYVTFTTPSDRGIQDDIARFVDRLQQVTPHLPLRTVPLEIQVFSPVVPRVHDAQAAAMRNQLEVRDAWLSELAHRFSSSELSVPIYDVPLR